MIHFAEVPSLFGNDGLKVIARPVESFVAKHRKQLLDQVSVSGAASLPDYELLELILFRAIPRKDVKSLAIALLETFGDFNQVVSASPARLAQFDGCGPAVIAELKIVEAAAQRLARAKVMQRCVISSWSAIIDYCHTMMSHRDTEQFRILFLDTKNTLIADEEHGTGTLDHVPVYPREVMKRALELNAASIILVHNHPSGDPTPSEAALLQGSSLGCYRGGPFLSGCCKCRTSSTPLVVTRSRSKNIV